MLNQIKIWMTPTS